MRMVLRASAVWSPLSLSWGGPRCFSCSYWWPREPSAPAVLMPMPWFDDISYSRSNQGAHSIWLWDQASDIADHSHVYRRQPR